VEAGGVLERDGEQDKTAFAAAGAAGDPLPAWAWDWATAASTVARITRSVAGWKGIRRRRR
jgi:hypothetical protein